MSAEPTPADIVALRVAPARAEKVLLAERAAKCFLCHRVRGRGRDFGPDLSRIGKKYTRAQLLDSILNPSKAIDPAFTTYQAETKSGLNHSGLLVQKTADEVVLKDANLNEVRLQLGDLKSLQASKVSAMPDGLFQSL